MSTRPSFSLGGGVLLMVMVVAIAQVTSGQVCEFGANNTKDLVFRNQTYISYTNNFLNSQTTYATQQILNVSTFNLTGYMVNTLLLNPKNLSYFVSFGKFSQLNWTAITLNYASKVSLPSYITDIYVNPVHVMMQSYANSYQISRGIYRPNLPNFYYYNINISSTGAVVWYTCLAGSRVVLSIPTNLTYSMSLTGNSPDFAAFATMIETSFDQFFRGAQSDFSNDFVRVNLISISRDSSSKSSLASFYGDVGALIELYFIRVYPASYIQSYVVNNIGLLPPLTFIGSVKSAVSINATGITAVENNITTSTIAPTTLITEIVTNSSSTTDLTLSSELFTESSTAFDVVTTSQQSFYSTLTQSTGQDVSTSSINTTITSNPTVTTNITQNSTSTLNLGNNTISGVPSVTTASIEVATFDADPLFLAVAPVLKKQFNDPAMLPKSLRASLSVTADDRHFTVQRGLYNIAIPAAAGMIGAIIGLMLCLQANWLGKLQK